MSRTFSVSELSALIKKQIESVPFFQALSVKGEISNCNASGGRGHLYFTLKDGDAVLRCVMFKGSAASLDFKPESGMTVVCEGRVSVYTAASEYVFYVNRMQPEGEGNIFVALEKLKIKLAAEGLFAPERKRRLPKYPMRVGVVTSATGAAVRDIITVSGRRFPSATLVVYPSLVQGAGAAKTLADGIRYFNARRSVDVIIIGRGGGSVEELWEFNNEALARTVAASDIPVVTAVGHEKDVSLCDFVSDLHAPTPSAAAEMVFPDRREVIRRFGNVLTRITTVAEREINIKKQRLSLLASSAALRNPTVGYDDKRRRIADLERRLFAATETERQRMRLSSLSERLEAAAKSQLKYTAMRLESRKSRLLVLDPLAVLERGYAAVFDTNGAALTSVEQLSAGSELRLRMADGEAAARVLEVKKNGV